MLIPCNRYILIEPLHENAGEKPVALFPESKKHEPKYQLFKLLAVAPDCEKFNGEVGHTLLVNAAMIEEISIHGERFWMVLEDFVVGLYVDQHSKT